MKEYIYVFDYNVGGIYEYELPQNLDDENIDIFINQKGHKNSDCYYMITDKELEIIKEDGNTL